MAQVNRVDVNTVCIGNTISSQEIDDSLWDSFVNSNPAGHYVQTSHWATLKKTIGWNYKRIVVKEQNQIVAGVQILIHPLPLFGKIFYSIKGPLDPQGIGRYDTEIMEFILQEARRNSCQLIVIQPPIDAPHLVGLLQDYGFKPSQLTPEHAATLILNLDTNLDQILNGMRRKTRQNVNKGEREGIKIIEGDHASLKTFYQLHLLTSKRQEFAPYPWKYIETLWQVLKPQNNLVLLLAEFQGSVISALLLICFNNTVYAYLLGWSGLQKEIRPNDALFWGAIQWAKAHEYRYFDFGGVDPQWAKVIQSGCKMPEAVLSTPDFLKYGFGGEIKIYPSAYDYLPNPLFNFIYRKLMNRIGGYNSKSSIFGRLRKGLMGK